MKIKRLMNGQTIFLLLLIGFTSGTLSGLVGVGGGIIIVPALVFFLGFSQQTAQGTSLGLLLLPVGTLAVVNYCNKGLIDWKMISVMCTAFVIGCWMGSRFALHISEQNAKRIFAVILFYTAIRMIGWDILVYKWIKQIS